MTLFAPTSLSSSTTTSSSLTMTRRTLSLLQWTSHLKNANQLLFKTALAPRHLPKTVVACYLSGFFGAMLYDQTVGFARRPQPRDD